MQEGASLYRMEERIFTYLARQYTGIEERIFTYLARHFISMEERIFTSSTRSS